MLLTLCLTSGSSFLLAVEKPEHRALAEYYAPVVYQESKSAVLDYITRFDYDGNSNGSNNWRNAYRYELRAHVYYGVVESTNHVLRFPTPFIIQGTSPLTPWKVSLQRPNMKTTWKAACS